MCWWYLGRAFLKLALLKSPAAMKASSGREVSILLITPYSLSGGLGEGWEGFMLYLLLDEEISFLETTTIYNI